VDVVLFQCNREEVEVPVSAWTDGISSRRLCVEVGSMVCQRREALAVRACNIVGTKISRRMRGPTLSKPMRVTFLDRQESEVFTSPVAEEIGGFADADIDERGTRTKAT